jgi:hypothetical protein
MDIMQEDGAETVASTTEQTAVDSTKRKRKRKDPLTSRQACIVYVASRQWEQVQRSVSKRDLAIGEKAKLLVSDGSVVSCQVIKFHLHGPNTGTYRAISPPVVKCKQATSADVGKPVFLLVKEATIEAPFGMAHCGILHSVSENTASISVRGVRTAVSVKSVHLQPSVYKYVPRDRIMRIPARFPREYSNHVIKMCAMKPGSHSKLCSYRKAMNKDLKLKNATSTTAGESKTGFPVLFSPW